MAEAETSVAPMVLSNGQKKRKRKKRLAEIAAAAAVATAEQREQNEQLNHDIEIAAAAARIEEEHLRRIDDERIKEERLRCIEIECIVEERPPLNLTTLLQTITTHTLKWTCDVCKAMHFLSFEDALEHEKSCTGQTVDDLAPCTTVQTRPTNHSSEDEAKELQRALENKTEELQRAQEKIDELQSSLATEAAAAEAAAAALAAEAASIDNEVQSNITKTGD